MSFGKCVNSLLIPFTEKVKTAHFTIDELTVKIRLSEITQI